MSVPSQSGAVAPVHSDDKALTRVLFVDDDLHLLQGLQRSLHGRVEVFTAPGALEALRVLDRDGPFPVLVTDQNMPQVDGVAFLKKVAEHFPDTVRMMLTGNADQKAAERAVNIGGVFRFLSKPCSTDQLYAAVCSAQREYDRRFAQKQVLEETVSGVTTLLTDMLAMAYPRAFARAGMVRAWVDTAVRVLNIPNSWALRTAAEVWPLSHIMLPDDVVERRSTGSGSHDADREKISTAYMAVARLLRNVPRFREVADLLVACRASFDEEALDGTPRPLQAELLRVLIDLSVIAEPGKPIAIDEHIAGVTQGVNRAVVAALPAILTSTTAESSSASMTLSAFEIAAGDMLLTDLTDDQGRLLLASGQQVSESIAAKIRQISSSGQISGRFKVLRRAKKGA